MSLWKMLFFIKLGQSLFSSKNCIYSTSKTAVDEIIDYGPLWFHDTLRITEKLLAILVFCSFLVKKIGPRGAQQYFSFRIQQSFPSKFTYQKRLKYLYTSVNSLYSAQFIPPSILLGLKNRTPKFAFVFRRTKN